MRYLEEVTRHVMTPEEATGGCVTPADESEQP
jgi:hypothetical protein